MTFEKHDDLGRDAESVIVGAVIREGSSALTCLGVTAITLFMRKNWYGRMEAAPRSVPAVTILRELERET